MYCDNQATVHTINAGRARNRFAQTCLRELFFWCARFDCQIRVEFIGTKQNRMADLLSRPFDEDCNVEFARLTKHMDVRIQQVPDSIFEFENDW